QPGVIGDPVLLVDIVEHRPAAGDQIIIAGRDAGIEVEVQGAVGIVGGRGGRLMPHDKGRSTTAIGITAAVFVGGPIEIACVEVHGWCSGSDVGSPATNGAVARPSGLTCHPRRSPFHAPIGAMSGETLATGGTSVGARASIAPASAAYKRPVGEGSSTAADKSARLAARPFGPLIQGRLR